MKLRMLVIAVLVTGGVETFAQSTYVGASVFGDIVRLGGTTSVFVDDTGGGEAIGFTVRVGTPLGAQWGVEAEFARPSEIDDERSNGVFPAQVTFSADLLPPGLSLPSPLFPPYSYRTTIRHTTFSTAAWVRQDLTARSSLVYLGGLGFYRTEHEFGLTFDPRALVAGTSLLILPFETETVFYGVRPFVGFEGRIGLGEHAQLVPGIRLHAVENGWLLRPGVGVNWMF